MSPPVVQLGGLQTEGRNARSAGIDSVSTEKLCQILNQEDAHVPVAVEKCIPVITDVIDVLSERVRDGGRIFYIGAGTSGRLGVLDASEIPPTYSAPSNQFVALIAGGDGALRSAKEGAEDDLKGAEADLQPLGLDPELDSIIGIASSGRTPYVLGGLSYAKSLGCTTVGVVCVEPSEVGMQGNADYLVSAVTGPEVVTGSTRMKAGTATKLVLNMISTGVMIRLGKTYGNLMVDVKATNVKLQQRAKNILRSIGGETCEHSDEKLGQILDTCHGSVKLAAVVIVLKVSVVEAEERLKAHQGVLSRVFEECKGQTSPRKEQEHDLVLCVDAGGTSCKAVVMSKNGETGIGMAGPCNLTSIGVDQVVSTISRAIQKAVESCPATTGNQAVKFLIAWIGISGYDRPSLAPMINVALSNLLEMNVGEHLRVTTDIDLLPARLALQSHLDSVIVLVAGTGSIAMSFRRRDGVLERTSRTGGWGHLIGDDGSGYGIGREALRQVLRSLDMCTVPPLDQDATSNLPALSLAVLNHFKEQYPSSEPENLLSTILAPEPGLHQTEGAESHTTKRMAGTAKVVLSMATVDDDAKSIVDAGAASLAQLVDTLVQRQGIEPSRSGLVLSGGLMQVEHYRNLVVSLVTDKCSNFSQVEVVDLPALEAAKHLLNCV